MSHLKGAVSAVFAIVATAATATASAAIIDSTQPYLTTTGTTHTDIVDGGNVSFFNAYDTSSVAMSGGQVSFLDAYGASSVAVSAGQLGFLTLHDSASATVSDGDISWLQVYDNSTASVTGAHDLSWLVVSTTAHVDIYATNTSFSSGLLSGTWLDGSLFEFWAVLGSPGSSTITDVLPSNITVRSPTSVPEPTTALLLALGLIGVGAAKRSRHSDRA
jgi:PEP-CTERM motif